MDNLLTLSEMAERFSIHPRTFARQVKAERIPHLRIGKLYRFHQSEVAHALGLASRYPQDRPPTWFTYLIWAEKTDRYKIGTALNVNKRLKELGTGSPFPLHLLAAIPSRLVSEAEMHRRFRDARVKGEWFEFSSPDVVLPAFGEWTEKKYRYWTGGTVYAR